ncbi:hypothetical protein [Paenibacillus donghaensis]|uniref:Cardiolipin synthase N-terminal domain-containing protein n=1 Tax=Paenibacillus donghaensis TaxID=414771 RepID=A0A2Z2KST0_9BACL|nr:hypothetical protein [Paenibacillus donghaensis]ASA26049.1 hypothetical protein B9T62_38280 [Paenibacillus donghaensis]
MTRRFSLAMILFWVLSIALLLTLGFGAYWMFPYIEDVYGDNMLWVMLVGAVLLVRLGLNVPIAVFIYRDASRRRLNRWFWMSVVLYIPNWIGLIIYMFVRQQKAGPPAVERPLPQTCPHCGKPI